MYTQFQIYAIDHTGVARIKVHEATTDVAGEYVCYANNDFGDTQGCLNVIVREATRITVNPENITTVAGDAVALNCQARSDPELSVTYTWLRDGRRLSDELINSGHYQLDSNNTLRIKHPTRFDSAAYTCNPTTRLDHVSSTGYLLIKDVPGPVTATYIICEPEKHRVEVNFLYSEHEKLANDVPEFWVQYQQNGSDLWQTYETRVKRPWGLAVVLKQETRLRHVAAALTVPLKQFGIYRFRVIARNEVGDSTPEEALRTCEIPPTTPEVNPSDVRVEAQTDKLLVYWEPMPREQWNGPDFYYIVKYKKKGDDDWSIVKVGDPYANHIQIEAVQKVGSQKYEVQLLAVNAMGLSALAPKTIDVFSRKLF